MNDDQYIVARRNENGEVEYLLAFITDHHPQGIMTEHRLAVYLRKRTGRPAYRWTDVHNLATMFDTADLAASANPDPTAWVEPVDHYQPRYPTERTTR